MQADIALIGLAVMGQNLVMNMADHGYTVAVYNRTHSVVDEFVNGRAKGMSIIGTHSLEEMVAVLKRPRKVMMLVKAGRLRLVDRVCAPEALMREAQTLAATLHDRHFADLPAVGVKRPNLDLDRPQRIRIRRGRIALRDVVRPVLAVVVVAVAATLVGELGHAAGFGQALALLVAAVELAVVVGRRALYVPLERAAKGGAAKGGPVNAK